MKKSMIKANSLLIKETFKNTKGNKNYGTSAYYSNP